MEGVCGWDEDDMEDTPYQITEKSLFIEAKPPNVYHSTHVLLAALIFPK